MNLFTGTAFQRQVLESHEPQGSKKLYDPTIFYAVDEDAVLCEVLEKVPALVSFHQSPLYSSVRAEEVTLPFYSQPCSRMA